MDINVGGKVFTASLTTLQKSPTVTTALDDGNVVTDSEGRLYFDRSPELFPYILQCLRDGTVLRPWTLHADQRAAIRREMAYFGIEVPDRVPALIFVVKGQLIALDPATMEVLPHWRVRLPHELQDCYVGDLRKIHYTKQDTVELFTTDGKGLSEHIDKEYSLPIFNPVWTRTKLQLPRHRGVLMIDEGGYASMQAIEDHPAFENGHTVHAVRTPGSGAYLPYTFVVDYEGNGFVRIGKAGDWQPIPKCPSTVYSLACVDHDTLVVGDSDDARTYVYTHDRFAKTGQWKLMASLCDMLPTQEERCLPIAVITESGTSCLLFGTKCHYYTRLNVQSGKYTRHSLPKEVATGTHLVCQGFVPNPLKMG